MLHLGAKLRRVRMGLEDSRVLVFPTSAVGCSVDPTLGLTSSRVSGPVAHSITSILIHIDGGLLGNLILLPSLASIRPTLSLLKST